MRVGFVIGFVCLAYGCGVEVGDPVEWPSLSGKADRADGVTVVGTLAIGQPSEREVEGIQGFTFLVGDGAVVDLEVTQGGSSRGLDVALAVYGPLDDNGNRVLVASDDDSGYGALPRLRGLRLHAGEHLVAVQAKSTTGHYRLMARCVGGTCTPLPEPCDVALLARLQRCARDAADASDEEPVDVFVAAEQCAQDEQLGRVKDATCDGGDAPAFCALPFERFDREVMPLCRETLTRATTYAYSAIGTSWYELMRSPYVRVLEKTRLDASSVLPADEQARIVLAVQASSHDDVRTAAEGFERVDEGIIDRYELAEVSAGRRLMAYIYGAGDNTYGRIFEHDRVLLDVHDGDLQGPLAGPGPVLADCWSDRDCAHGLHCGGITEAARGLGKCGPFTKPTVGDVVCHNDGCTPGWLEQRFFDIDGIPIVGFPITRTLVAYGLGTHTVEVEATVELEGDARATLIDPGGHETPVSTSGVTTWRHVGPANGRWRLRLEGAGAATLQGWSLRVTSDL